MQRVRIHVIQQCARWSQPQGYREPTAEGLDKPPMLMIRPQFS
jgi:hypothetical protein